MVTLCLVCITNIPRCFIGLWIIFCQIWQKITSALQQVVPQEKTPERMLYTSTHLHKVTQNIPTWLLTGLNVDHPYSNQQVPVIFIRSSLGSYIDWLH